MRPIGPSLGPVHGVKCQFCRTWFDRPTDLEPHIPATACPAPGCQGRRRAHEEELARRVRMHRASIRPRDEVLRPAALN